MLNILIKNSIKLLSKQQKQLKKQRKEKGNDLGSIQNKIAKNKALLTMLFNHKPIKAKYSCNPIFPLDLKILFKGSNGLEIKTAKSWYFAYKNVPSIKLDERLYIRSGEIIAIGDEAEKLLQKHQEKIENSIEKRNLDEKEQLWHDTLRIYEPEYQKISNEFHKKIEELKKERELAITKLNNIFDINRKNNEYHEAQKAYKDLKCGRK